MTLSVWRYSHLALALVSSLFLVLASVTGVILGVDAINERVALYRVKDLNEINLAETLTALSRVYPEITALEVDYNDFVLLKAIDADENDVNAYIDPHNGKILGTPQKKSNFIQWVLAFHRSLFLHNAGRIFVGIITFLLLLIVLSGMFLVVQRQQGFRKFFNRIVNENFAGYFHVIFGRLSLVPIFLIALSGIYLSLVNLDLFTAKNPQIVLENTSEEVTTKKDFQNFEIFQQTRLADVQKLEFPFFEDPEEFYTLKLKKQEMIVNQFSGEIEHITKYPFLILAERLSLDLHTGRTSILWALILIIATLNILFFIYTGFVITLKRRAVLIRNKFKSAESEFIILVGSENGSTLKMANVIHQQLLAQGKASFFAEMNSYTFFPKAKHLVVFPATYGLGEPPSNANKFISLLFSFQQQNEIFTTVVGFGSRAYVNFCAYAKQIEAVLSKQSWAKPCMPLTEISDKSAEQFSEWVKTWSENAGIELDNSPSLFDVKPTNLKKMKVIQKTNTRDNEETFSLVLRPRFKNSFSSGDLLAVYPAGDERERLYSIGKVDNKIQLTVKLLPNGFGSEFLYNLKQNTTIRARILRNTHFHFPKKASQILMISNGTGIAPFLGMIDENKSKKQLYLFSGFRRNTNLTNEYTTFLNKKFGQGRIAGFQFAFSREDDSEYVMDILNQNAAFVGSLMKNGGIVMICGSQAMLKDVEKTINTICLSYNKNGLAYYKQNGQILQDCY